VSDYFDTRLDLFFGRALLLLPPRQALVADLLARSGAATPRLAAGGGPPANSAGTEPVVFPGLTGRVEPRLPLPPTPKVSGADHRD
jgi:hypothetical protein